MSNLQIADTHTVDDIIMAVSFAEAAGDISLIYGDAGLGKTVSLKNMFLYIQIPFMLN